MLLISWIVMIILTFVFPFNERHTGSAKCISETLTDVIDVNTIQVDKYTIKLALISNPWIDESSSTNSKEFIESICPLDL